MNDKKHISEYGKVFEYLKDPALRQKEKGDAVMEVKGALISGVKFKGQTWKNIRFIECDFTGSYEMNLSELRNCVFEGCRFAGLFGFGVATSVYFNKIEVRGNNESAIYTDKGSTDVVFENGDFRSLSDNTNHWAGLVMYGEVRYVNCYAKWFELYGSEKFVMERCRMDNVVLLKTSKEERPAVTITDTEFLGKTDMVSSYMSSLTMRNCTVGVLDLMDAKVSGDVLIEKVDGVSINLSVNSAHNVTVRNCKLTGPNGDGFAFEIGAYGTDQLLLENCDFKDKPVAIGPGGTLPEDVLNAAPQNKLTRLSRCSMGSLDAAYSLGDALRIDLCTISCADFSHSRIGSLQIEASTISQKLDLSNTRIKSYSIKDLEPSKYRKVLLEGSTIKQLAI